MEPITTQSGVSAQPQVSPELQRQRSMRRKLVAAIIVLILIAAAGWWFYGQRENSQVIGPGQTLVTAQAGTAVRGFPQELILEKDATILKSYRVDYAAGGVGQPVVIYDSKLSVNKNLIAFRVYFVQNGWELIQYGNASQLPATSVLAVNGSAEANVTLEPLPENKTRVTISYTVKG